MTPNEFSHMLVDLGISQKQFALLFGIGVRTVTHWKAHGLDESAGGAQAAMARTLKLFAAMSRNEVKSAIRGQLDALEDAA